MHRFHQTLPSRPSETDVPMENYSPTANWLGVFTRSPAEWPDWVAQHPGDWLPTDGLPGEVAVVAGLESLVDPQAAYPGLYLVLHGLKIAPALDADVVVLSRYGVRLLEVKYWQGLVRWREGKLTHLNLFHGPGGALQQRERSEQDPFRQLRNELALLRNGLTALDDILENRNWLDGALVFAHPDCVIDVDSTAGDVTLLRPAEVTDWLLGERGEPVFEISHLFQLADWLIQRSREFEAGAPQDVGDLAQWARELMAFWRQEGPRQLEQVMAYFANNLGLSEKYKRLHKKRQRMT